MIKQMFKIVWKRKRANLLIVLEITFTFLALVGIMTTGVYFLDNYSLPMGFSYENVWDLNAYQGLLFNENFDDDTHEKILSFKAVLEEFDEIENIGGMTYMPFSLVMSGTDFRYEDGKEAFAQLTYSTDGIKDVINPEVIQGRWFSPEDDGLNRRAVIINRRLRDELFKMEDPIGKILTTGKDDKIKEYRVVGVVTDFRKNGRLEGPSNFALYRISETNREFAPAQNLVFTVRPGSTAELEERILKKVQLMAPNWTFEVNRLEDRYSTTTKPRMITYTVFAIICASVLMMVGMGLMGVLWLNVTRRTRETGLRRAKGATKVKIHHQILGELMFVSSFGIIIGSIIVIQFPLLQIIPFFSLKIYIAGILLSALVIFVLTLACGYYPARMATSFQPADALRYE